MTTMLWIVGVLRGEEDGGGLEVREREKRAKQGLREGDGCTL